MRITVLVWDYGMMIFSGIAHRQTNTHTHTHTLGCSSMLFYSRASLSNLSSQLSHQRFFFPSDGSAWINDGRSIAVLLLLIFFILLSAVLALVAIHTHSRLKTKLKQPRSPVLSARDYAILEAARGSADSGAPKSQASTLHYDYSLTMGTTPGQEPTAPTVDGYDIPTSFNTMPRNGTLKATPNNVAVVNRTSADYASCDYADMEAKEAARNDRVNDYMEPSDWVIMMSSLRKDDIIDQVTALSLTSHQHQTDKLEDLFIPTKLSQRNLFNAKENHVL